MTNRALTKPQQKETVATHVDAVFANCNDWYRTIWRIETRIAINSFVCVPMVARRKARILFRIVLRIRVTEFAQRDYIHFVFLWRIK